MSTSDTRELERLLKEVVERLEVVEQRLGIRRAPTPPVAPDLPARQAVIELTRTFPAPAKAPPVAARQSEEPSPPAERIESLAAVTPEPALRQPPPPPSPVSEPVVIAHRAEPWSIERAVGGRYFLAAGAIVVVIGVGLFLKLGYDMGWFRMSNAWKCIWGAIFGAAMIGGGEVVRRRINVLASTGLSAAGLGALYLSTYAAHGFYSLIGPAVAFVFLAAIVAIGVVIAVLARQVGVAILSLLGGYLAPFLLNIDHPSPTVIPLHSFALLATGLCLSGWRPSVFRVLRTISWWGTLVLATIWMMQQGVDHPLIALPFLALVWAAVHAELIFSVRGEYESDAPADESAAALLLNWRSIRPVATSLSTSVWCVFFGVIALRTTPVLPDWFVPAAATAAASLLAAMLAGHLRVLRDSPRTDAQRLGAGLAMQAGAALIAAIALAFSGSLEVCAWLGVGVAAVAAGSWIGAPSLAAYGLVPLAIAAFRLVTWDAFRTRAGFTPLSLGTLVVDRWTLLMIFGAAAWIGSALLFARLRERLSGVVASSGGGGTSVRFLRVPPDACTIVGLMLLLASFIHAKTSPGAVSIAWLGVGVLVGVSRLWERRIKLALYSIGVLVLASLAWWTAYGGLGWTATAGDAIFYRGAFVGMFLTFAWGGLAVWYRRDRADVGRVAWIACSIAALFFAWFVSSLEVQRLAGRIEPGLRDSAGALAVWWCLFAAALFVVAFRRQIRALHAVGLSVMSIAIAAWVVAFVAPGWRSTSDANLLHPGFAIAAVLIGVMAALARRWRAALKESGGDARTAVLSLMIGAISLGWVATSLEVARFAQHIEPGARAQGGGLSMWWCVWGAALVVAGFTCRARAMRIAGGFVMVLSLIAWSIAFIIPGWTAASHDAVIHPGLFISVALVGALALLARRFRHHLFSGEDDDRAGLIGMIAVAVVLAWVSTSLEAFRLAHHFQSGKYAQHAAVSVWWGFFSIALLVAGFRHRVASLRYAGLALLGIATLKALILDLSEVSAGWRVVSVLGLGLLMLGVALAYVRTSAKLFGPPPPAQPPPSPPDEKRNYVVPTGKTEPQQ